MELRYYQREAVDAIFNYYVTMKKTGSSLVTVPTGGGKSIILSTFIAEAIQKFPGIRVIQLVHSRELVEQNYKCFKKQFPHIDAGVYSAGLNRRDTDNKVIFASIQSVFKKSQQIGRFNIAVIDECFVAGTKISTPSGEIDIDKVRCGDIVYSQCGVGVVEATSCKTTEETFIVELDNGRTIECTGNHPFFTETGWKISKELEPGESLFSIKDMSSMWRRVSSLDKDGKWENEVMHPGNHMDKSKMLLNKVCEEISSDSIKCTSSKENKQQIEGNKTSSYKAWRERAIASFATASSSSCSWGWMESGICSENECRPSKWDLSESLQNRHSESRKDDSDRNKWRFSSESRKKESRSKENSIISSVRVVSIRRIERKSHTLVFNLQISGHPSYFANGIAVHNCHSISDKEGTRYHTLLNDLRGLYTNMKIVGFTATPYRMDCGYITNGDNPIFDTIVYSCSIKDLIADGYLSNITTYCSDTQIDTSNISLVAGEYNLKELEAASDNPYVNSTAIQDAITKGHNRKSWLFFCASIKHAEHIKEALVLRGIVAEIVTGDTPIAQRAQILNDFKDNKIRCLVNVNVLTTGFDHKGIDLIVSLRPTCSPGLWTQMVGRGLRIENEKENCLILDYSGNIEKHGPIDNINPPSPRKLGKSKGEVQKLNRICEKCFAVNDIKAFMCKHCNTLFVVERKPPEIQDKSSTAEILSKVTNHKVTKINYGLHEKDGKTSLKVIYFSGMLKYYVEFICIEHGGYATEKARLWWDKRCSLSFPGSCDEAIELVDFLEKPKEIQVDESSKYPRVIGYKF